MYKLKFRFGPRGRMVIASLMVGLVAACNDGTSGNAGDPADPPSAPTTLHAFAVPNFQPRGITEDSSGNLYGVTDGDSGSVYEVTASGQFTELHVFDNSDGNDPSPGLVVAPDGTLYGATQTGGTYNAGTIYKITPDGTFSTVYAFTGVDGARPGQMMLGTDGNLYGVTYTGGPAFTSMSDASTQGDGTVYKMTPNGSLTTLYAFSGLDGFMPVVLIQGTNGDLFGTTAGGGPTFQNATQFGAGTVFELTAAGTLTSLYAFDGVTARQPTSLVSGAGGALFGTTADSSNANGIVFEVAPDGTFSVIHQFDGTDGQGPSALIAGQNGNFYGATEQGGSGFAPDSMDLGWGTIFEITPSGTLTTLYSFDDGKDGATPDALVLSNNGDLYGVASQGGANAALGGGGTVFELSLSGLQVP